MCLSLSSQESEEGPSPLLQPVPSSSLFLHSLGFGQNSASFLALALILSPSKQPCFCRWSFEQWGGGGGGSGAGELQARELPFSVCVASDLYLPLFWWPGFSSVSSVSSLPGFCCCLCMAPATHAWLSCHGGPIACCMLRLPATPGTSSTQAPAPCLGRPRTGGLWSRAYSPPGAAPAAGTWGSGMHCTTLPTTYH